MRTRLAFSLALALVALGVRAQEKSTLVTPATAVVTDYEIMSIDIGRIPTWLLTIQYRDNLGNIFMDRHVGTVESGSPAPADALVRALNKADLSTKSLERRALEHLISEGKIPPATITGNPQ